MWALLVAASLLALWRTVLWNPRRVPGVSAPSSGPLLLGHRGVRGSHPENTLAAFRAAFDAPLDGIECDVLRSRDGQLVLHHDFTLPDGRAVDRLTLAELRAAHPDMPTLDDLLELARNHPGTLLNLEIKSRTVRSDGVERDLAEGVRASGLGGRVIVSSFNPLTLLRMRFVAPELRTAFLYSPDGPAGLRSAWLAPWLHVDAIHPAEAVVDRALVDWAHERRLALNTWTVNDPERVRALVRLGVDGIIADDPDSLLRAAGRVTAVG